MLGLASLDQADARGRLAWHERRLAGTLLDDTRLYRQAAQEHGMTDMAHVMRDLETVLIETSMSDTSDRGALARVQRLISSVISWWEDAARGGGLNGTIMKMRMFVASVFAVAVLGGGLEAAASPAPD